MLLPKGLAPGASHPGDPGLSKGGPASQDEGGLAISCWLLAVGYWLLAVGYWLLAVGYWLLAVGYWLLAVGCWLLVQTVFQIENQHRENPFIAAGFHISHAGNVILVSIQVQKLSRRKGDLNSGIGS